MSNCPFEQRLVYLSNRFTFSKFESILKCEMIALLDNQKENSANYKNKKFSRMSMIASATVFAELSIKNLISFQVLDKNEYYRFVADEYIKNECSPVEERTGIYLYSNNYDDEEKQSASAGMQIARILDRAIINEIAFDSATKMGSNRHRFITDFSDLCEIIKSKSNRDVSWVVMSPNNIDLFDCYSNPYSFLGNIVKVGTHEGINIYCDHGLSDNVVILGAKGNFWNDCGYFFCPKLLVSKGREEPNKTSVYCNSFRKMIDSTYYGTMIFQ